MTSLFKPLFSHTLRTTPSIYKTPITRIVSVQYRFMSAEHPAKKINMSTIKIGTHK